MESSQDSAPRNLLVGAVSIVRRPRIRLAGALLAIRNNLEPHLAHACFLEGAPFRTVNLILQVGTGDDFEPPDKYTLDAKHSELQVNVQLDAARLKALEPDELKFRAALRLAVLEVLQDVAANYDLPYAFLDDLASETNQVFGSVA